MNKSLKIIASNHNGIVLDITLKGDTEGLTFEFNFKDANGAPLHELNGETDDMFGFLKVIIDRAVGLANFLETQSEDNDTTEGDTVN